MGQEQVIAEFANFSLHYLVRTYDIKHDWCLWFYRDWTVHLVLEGRWLAAGFSLTEKEQQSVCLCVNSPGPVSPPLCNIPLLQYMCKDRTEKMTSRCFTHTSDCTQHLNKPGIKSQITISVKSVVCFHVHTCPGFHHFSVQKQNLDLCFEKHR